MKEIFVKALLLAIFSIVFQRATVLIAQDDIPSTKGGRVVIYYGGGTPIHFNPAVQTGTSTALVGTQLFAGLLRYGKDWSPQPYLAKKWHVSPDGLTVTFDIVENARFHDGKPVTAEDVAFSIRTVRDYHPFKSMLSPVDAVNVVGPHRIELSLLHPHPALFLCLSPALTPIIPKHIYGNGGDLRKHPANLMPVGSGPFRLIDHEPGKYIKLGRFEDFFIPARPYLDEILIRLVREPSAQMIALQRQDAHILAPFIDYASLDALKENPHLISTNKGYDAIGPIVWLAFNLKHAPLNDRRVRQAMAYAMDHEFIINSMHQGRSVRADGPITPSSPYYYQNIKKYSLDLAKAKSLLDAAGLAPGQDGIRFEIGLDYIPVLPSQHKDIAHYLKRQFAKIGVIVNIRTSETFPKWAVKVSNWDFEMTLDSVYNWGDPLIGVHRTYHSSNIRKGVIWSNTQNYRNEKVDQILDQAARELNTNRRKKLYDEFQKIVAEELPVIWLNVLPFHTIYHQGLGNPPISIWGLHSPLDALYWKKRPSKDIRPIPLSYQMDEKASIENCGRHIIDLLNNYELDIVSEFISKPENGYVDLEKTGLHAIGSTRQGVIFLDNSRQMRPGMEISGIMDLSGDKILSTLIQASGEKSSGHLKLKSVFPNPTNNQLTLASIWCGELKSSDFICVIKWQEE